MKITTIGTDLAKNVFQVHGVDERGKAVLRKQLKRKDVVKFFANLERCVIGMEACGSAHYWARKTSSARSSNLQERATSLLSCQTTGFLR